MSLKPVLKSSLTAKRRFFYIMNTTLNTGILWDSYLFFNKWHNTIFSTIDILLTILFNSNWYCFFANLSSLFTQLIWFDKTFLRIFFVFWYAGKLGGLSFRNFGQIPNSKHDSKYFKSKTSFVTFKPAFSSFLKCETATSHLFCNLWYNFQNLQSFIKPDQLCE